MYLGIDIGGANLKYADERGKTHSVDFPMWMRPDELAEQLVADFARFPATESLAITMTGELADCFLDRGEGVRRIVRAAQVAAEKRRIENVAFYSVDAVWRSSEQAIEHPDLVAAANWHATAAWLARELASEGIPGMPKLGRALVVDIGSTTTDLIPIDPPHVLTRAQTDFDRLREGSLIYLGGHRTPICSLTSQLQFEGREIPVMREVFATMDDVRMLLGHCEEAPEDRASADGKPRDRFHAANRMARMLGLDHRSVEIAQGVVLAEQIYAQVSRTIEAAIESLCDRFHLERLLMLGHSQDLIGSATRERFAAVDLKNVLSESIARVGPAYAVAQLAQRDRAG